MATQQDCIELREKLICFVHRNKKMLSPQSRILMIDCILMIESHEALLDILAENDSKNNIVPTIKNIA